MKHIFFVVTGLISLIAGMIVLALFHFVETAYTSILISWILKGLVLVILGFFLLIKSYRLSNARFIRNRYVIRQLVAFFILVILCIFIMAQLISKDDTGRIMQNMVWPFLGIGFSFILLLIQITKFVQNTKIQDGFFETSQFHENRTFFSMVVDQHWKEGQMMYLQGRVHGTVCRKDKFTFYFTTQSSLRNKVLELQVDGQKVDRATDQEVIIKIKMNWPLQLGYCTVISSAIAYQNTNIETPVSNPSALGLIASIPEQKNNAYFHNYLWDSIVHGHYLVIVDRRPIPLPIIQKIYMFFFGYHGPYMMRTIMDADKNEALAIYTDWQQAKKSKEPREKIEEALVMSFDEIQHYVLSQTNLDLAINPFSDYRLYIENHQIKEIVSSVGYQENIINKRA